MGELLTRAQVEQIAEHTKQVLEQLSDLESIDAWLAHDAALREQAAGVTQTRYPFSFAAWCREQARKAQP